MMDMNAGVETVIVTTGVVVMLGMAVWLFFRIEGNGEKSFFLKILEPYDNDFKQRASVPIFFPSYKRRTIKDARTNYGEHVDLLNQNVSEALGVQPKETSMKSQLALTTKLQNRKNSIQTEPARPSSGRNWQKSAAMFSGQESLGVILVVDDDPSIRKLISIILENAGYDVLVAGDGQDAINVVRSGENPMVIDAIITDLTMPNMDGCEAITYFQKEFPSIPVIILTGIADVELAVSYMRQGISNYLVKPVDGKKLTASVANAIAQRQLPGG